jgi:hypothetical protein
LSNRANAGQLNGRLSEGGFGNISQIQNRRPENVNRDNLQNQGQGIRNSFNNNNINKNNLNQFNQYNVNRYGGYGGYHPYGGYGYHPPYGYGGWGYPGSWYGPGWGAATAWTCAGLTTLGGFLGMAALSGGSSQPSSSSNVTYEGDTVYVNGQPDVSDAQYYQQAQQLAQVGYSAPQNSGYDASTNFSMDAPQPTAANAAEQWQPLGVFALAEPGQTQSNMMVQLAINSAGIVRGNYYNQLTNEQSEVYGSLDKNTQRVSWTIGTNPNTVFDAGLGDLTQNDSSVLVHYGPNNTSRMALIRLQQPPDTGPPPPQQS